jgi:hypothetical protein
MQLCIEATTAPLEAEAGEAMEAMEAREAMEASVATEVNGVTRDHIEALVAMTEEAGSTRGAGTARTKLSTNILVIL